jgi:hypothetical protein
VRESQRCRRILSSVCLGCMLHAMPSEVAARVTSLTG